MSTDPTIAEQVENWFSHHPPTGNQAIRYNHIRAYAKNLAHVIVRACPYSADRTAALRKLREVVMIANASIACNETPENSTRASDYFGEVLLPNEA